METQKALEKHMEECKHRIEVIKILLVTENRTIGECSENIETLKTVISALEKQIPKKPINKTRSITAYGSKFITYGCPTCGNILSEVKYRYCCNCGQAFDWSDWE